MSLLSCEPNADYIDYVGLQALNNVFQQIIPVYYRYVRKNTGVLSEITGSSKDAETIGKSLLRNSPELMPNR